MQSVKRASALQGYVPTPSTSTTSRESRLLRWCRSAQMGNARSWLDTSTQHVARRLSITSQPPACLLGGLPVPLLARPQHQLRRVWLMLHCTTPLTRLQGALT